MELRCESRKLHGIVIESHNLNGVDIDGATGVIEVACDNRLCGKEPGVAVRHRFDLSNGKLIETKKFQDPSKLFSTRKKEETDVTSNNRPVALRHS